VTNSTSLKLSFPFNRSNEQLLLPLLHLQEVVKVVVEVEEAKGVKEVKAKAVAEEEGIIRTIYLTYQNRLAYKRSERIIVYFVTRRAISKGTIIPIKGLKNLYLKSLRNLLI
jgi:hypothetical protein